MSFETTAPPLILQMRTQLAGSPTWSGLVGAANASDRIHYPAINLRGTRDAIDRIPAALLMKPATSRRKWVEGAGGLINGSFSIMFYFPALTSGQTPAGFGVGKIENMVDTICAELFAQRSGIPFRDDFQVGEASDPTDAEIAAHSDDTPAAFRSCLATLPYGYSS